MRVTVRTLEYHPPVQSNMMLLTIAGGVALPPSFPGPPGVPRQKLTLPGTRVVLNSPPMRFTMKVPAVHSPQPSCEQQEPLTRHTATA